MPTCQTLMRAWWVPVLLLWPALLAVPPAAAQNAPVYRCGSSYQAQPCAGGVAVDAADPRSDAQRREAEAVRQRDAALARQMAADRGAAERAAARNGRPANVGPSSAAAAPAKPAAPSAKARKKPKSVKLKPATSTSPTRTERSTGT